MPSLSIRNLYYYVVCLVTLIMTIVGGVQLVQSGLDLALPPEAYRPSPVDVEARFRGPSEAPSVYTREELEAYAEEEAARAARDQRRNALRSLLGNLALVGLAAPVYVYHWRAVRRADPV